MKKILIALTIVISCLGISRVFADTIDYVHSDILKSNCDYYYVDYDNVKSLGYEEQLQEIYNMLLEEYNKNYSTQYSYYYLHFVVMNKQNCNQTSKPTSIGSITGFLNLYTDIPTLPLGDGDFVLSSSYNVDSKTYITPSIISGYYYPWLFDTQYNPLSYFTSNFELINNTKYTYVVTGNSNFIINPGDVIKPVFTADNVFQINYTEINLNDYAYVALALKDYQQDPFETTVQVKGQYCLTPVYGMGLETYEDMKGTKVQNVCSPYYDNYTPVKTYITKDNISYYSIYYVKAYDTTRDNYIKVDTSVFDISYITEENKNNPYVLIQGKTYPTIPYDNLPSSATQNTQEGYIPGQSEEFTFLDIFTAPLEFLTELWGTISEFFTLISRFILLLPKSLQGFLLTSFTLAIALGLIKILL